MLSRIPPAFLRDRADADDFEPNDGTTAAAHELRALAARPRPDGRRSFVLYVDGTPARLRVARSGRAAEARERAARRIPPAHAERVRAVWAPAAPLAVVAYVRVVGL